ncbi:MAG: HAD family hydrolase [Planctomycetota bacterium]|nr:HAD family hydrolase [Planctomycetota bacterium]
MARPVGDFTLLGYPEFMNKALRIAMWSGPRNISSALMRAWETRPDTVVCDEPLYGHYLHTTGFDHPAAEEVIASQSTDWREVVAWLTGPIPGQHTVFYQKHMAHHLLPNIKLDWLDHVVNCFLIRSPQEMLTSLLEILPNPSLSDTGLPQQVEIFHHVQQRLGSAPPVLDSRDVLEHPRQMLSALCNLIQVPFLDSMLHWPAGQRETDGVWANHWYGNVEKSTGFGAYRPKDKKVPERFQPLLKACEPLYQELATHRITI